MNNTFILATLSHIKSDSPHTSINIRNNTRYNNNSVTPTSHNTLSATNYHSKNVSSSSLSSHYLSPKHAQSLNYHFLQNYHYHNNKTSVTSLKKSNHYDFNNMEKASNNHSLVNLQQKGGYSTSLYGQKSKKYEGHHYNKCKNSTDTSSNNHKKGQQKYKGYDFGKYIKDDYNLFLEQEGYYPSYNYNLSHVRNKREDIKNPTQYAPNNSSLIINECFPSTAVCTNPVPSTNPIQYTLDFGRFGTFKVSDSYHARNKTAVKEHIQIAINKIGEIFGNAILNDVVKHNCTLDLSPPPSPKYVWDQKTQKLIYVSYGESGVYPSKPWPSVDHAQVIICNIRASSFINTDFRVLEHEIAHAIINGMLRGKMDSMPRFFTEGFATVVMNYDSDTIKQRGIDYAHNIVVQHDWKDFFELLTFVQPQHNHPYNYDVGSSWLLFCNHKSPDAIREYLYEIIREEYRSTFNIVDVRNFIGINDLEAQCGMHDFKQWLNDPDTSKGDYKITDGDTTTSQQHEKITSDSKDLVLLCHSKSKAYVCDQPQYLIKTLEDYIGVNCSLASNNTSLHSNDHIVFSYDKIDRYGVIVLELQQDGFTFTRATYNEITKHHCKGWHNWLQSAFIKPILDINGANDCNVLNIDYFIGEMQRCLQIPVTQADFNMWPQSILQNSTVHVSENTIETPLWWIVGGTFGMLAIGGVSYGVYKCNNTTKSAKKNTDNVEEGIKLNTFKTNEVPETMHMKEVVLHAQQHMNYMHQNELQDEQYMALLHQTKLQHHQELCNQQLLNAYAVNINGDNNDNDDWN